MRRNKKVLHLCEAALVAAMYFVLTWLSNFAGLASGAVQLRLSEALCILPYFMPSAVPGLFIGCIISNITMGSVIFDTMFGSLATLIGAYIASKIKNKWLVPLPTVVANTVIVPFVVLFCYTEVRSVSAYLLALCGVFAGEVVSAYVLGLILLYAMNNKKGLFNKKH